MPSDSQTKMPPPRSDISMAQKASSGIMTTAAISRGMTSASIGDTPMVRMASISSVIFIVPSCAAKAEPDRPATMIAVIKVPSSRTVIRPMRLIV